MAQRCTSSTATSPRPVRPWFGMPPNVVAASLGNLGVEEVVDIEEQLSDNFAIGRDECLQRQPRVSSNALPPDTSSAASSGSSSSSATSSTAMTATPGRREESYLPVQFRKRD